MRLRFWLLIISVIRGLSVIGRLSVCQPTLGEEIMYAPILAESPLFDIGYDNAIIMSNIHNKTVLKNDGN